jgi:hypothetical protein
MSAWPQVNPESVRTLIKSLRNQALRGAAALNAGRRLGAFHARQQYSVI